MSDGIMDVGIEITMTFDFNTINSRLFSDKLTHNVYVVTACSWLLMSIWLVYLFLTKRKVSMLTMKVYASMLCCAVAEFISVMFIVTHTRSYVRYVFYAVGQQVVYSNLLFYVRMWFEKIFRNIDGSDNFQNMFYNNNVGKVKTSLNNVLDVIEYITYVNTVLFYILGPVSIYETHYYSYINYIYFIRMFMSCVTTIALCSVVIFAGNRILYNATNVTAGELGMKKNIGYAVMISKLCIGLQVMSVIMLCLWPYWQFYALFWYQCIVYNATMVTASIFIISVPSYFSNSFHTTSHRAN